MKLVYVCSPLRGDMEKNIEKAHGYCAYAADCGMIPLAPHTIFTKYLDDQRSEQRQQGLTMGLALLKRCDEIWVMGKEISQGMQGEIELAKAEHIPTMYVSDTLVESNYKIRQEQAPFSYDDCVPDSNKMNYENQIIVLKPEAFGQGADITSDDSLWIPYSGNGCTYGARGQAVFAESLFFGECVHWERADFCGVVEPTRLLEWMTDKPVYNERAAEIVRQVEQEVGLEFDHAAEHEDEYEI